MFTINGTASSPVLTWSKKTKSGWKMEHSSSDSSQMRRSSSIMSLSSSVLLMCFVWMMKRLAMIFPSSSKAVSKVMGLEPPRNACWGDEKLMLMHILTRWMMNVTSPSSRESSIYSPFGMTTPRLS